MTIIAVQCRLSSTRLPRKALLDLDGIQLVEWTLHTLKKVKVDQYWIATDEDSYPILSKIAQDNNWNCFAGPQNDVLERYCLLAEKTGATTILRGTADNPFLFYEAAQKSLIEFEQRNCDYFAFTGLPHGSGIEVFSASAILKARNLTNDPYDHEHVGPSLYNHPEWFSSVYVESPFEWTHKTEKKDVFRTTVDTIEDYRRAHRIISFLNKNNATKPYSANDIFMALESEYVKNPLLFVPTVKEGHGTGHIRRILRIIENLSKKGVCADLLLLEDPSISVKMILDNAMLGKPGMILREYPQKGEYAAIITDYFELEYAIAKKLHEIAPLISIDEGSKNKDYCDFTLNILPPLKKNDNANIFVPQFLEIPQINTKPVNEPKKVLISIGGEDPSHFSALLEEKLTKISKKIGFELVNTQKTPIANLKDHLYEYDVVFTHFGMTAFESLASGCKIVSVATSPIHKELSKQYEILCLEKKDCSENKLLQLLENYTSIDNTVLKNAINANLDVNFVAIEDFILNLSKGTQYSCPICKKNDNPVVSRDSIKTIKKCTQCSLHYISFVIDTELEYNEEYFFESYKNQYGKTYLEDFDCIKSQGFRRLDCIKSLCNPKDSTLLDVGCAYGPFLSAAKDYGFIPFGTDVSESAVQYVKEQLGFEANCVDFYNFSTEKQFDVITQWYVIEHFQDIDAILKIVHKLLKNGGIFAFSTPNVQGITGKCNKKTFFNQSPDDHYTLWDAKSCKNILTNYGFTVKKIVTTGVHKERFPLFLRKLPNPIFLWITNLLKLGDTFEVYCEKGNN